MPSALTTAEFDATMVYAEAEKALATRAAYASDWRAASPRGAPPGGATAGGMWAISGRGEGVQYGCEAVMGYHHKIAGHEPRLVGGSRVVMRGIRNDRKEK